MNIAAGYARVMERIGAAAARAGRSPEEITLVAVTKTWPAEVVAAAFEAGIRHIGENRAEELARKKAEVDSLLGGNSGLQWHLIGPLQSRKSNLAADNADVFHALDRLKIARRISGRLVENGRAAAAELPVMLEVNISGEASKAGFDVRNWAENETQRELFLASALEISLLPGLKVRGLMTMAPWVTDASVVRNVFRRTREFADWLRQSLPELEWSSLSMGMTDDFELAIEEGASYVRVGRAIFGERG